MKRLALAGLGVVLTAAVVGAGWYYRPWSDYSPASISALDDPAAYPDLFQRMDEILPASTVAATTPAPLSRAIEAHDFSYEWNGETKTLDAYMAEADIIGLTVLRDGVIIDEMFRQGAGPDTLFTSWSVAKSVVATLIATALDDGLIESLDDPAERYAPQFAGTDYGATSLRHLLMMSAGVDFNEEYRDGEPSDVRPLFFNAFILGRNVDDMVGAIERDREPGQDNHYTSPNSHVLAAVARGAYGGRLADIVSSELWGPLGMTADASWLQNTPAEDGIAIGYCCLQATSADYARFGEFYRQDGVWGGERLLPEGWSVQATTPNAPFQEPGATPYAGRGYGLHFWVPEGYDGEFFAAGVFGQYIWVDRRRGVVIAQNAGDPNWGGRQSEAFHVFRTLAETVSPLASRTADLSNTEAESDA